MHLENILNYRLKYCWTQVVYCICQQNELATEIKKKVGGGQAKILACHVPSKPPLKSPLAVAVWSSGYPPLGSNLLSTLCWRQGIMLWRTGSEVATRLWAPRTFLEFVVKTGCILDAWKTVCSWIFSGVLESSWTV